MKRPVLHSCLALSVWGPTSAGVGETPPPTPSTYPLQGGFVDAHGVLLYYKTVGRGRPLLILHGGPGASHDYLLPHLLPLARRHRLVFIDERGSGRSERLENTRTYTLENMVEDGEAGRQAPPPDKVARLRP